MVGHAAVLELADDAGQAAVLFEHLQCNLQHRALALLRADAEHVFQQTVQHSHAALYWHSTRICDSTRPRPRLVTPGRSRDHSRSVVGKNPEIVGRKLEKRFTAAGGKSVITTKAQRNEREQLFHAVG